MTIATWNVRLILGSESHKNIFTGNELDELLVDLEQVLIRNAASGKHNIFGDLITTDFSGESSWVNLVFLLELFEGAFFIVGVKDVLGVEPDSTDTPDEKSNNLHISLHNKVL